MQPDNQQLPVAAQPTAPPIQPPTQPAMQNSGGVLPAGASGDKKKPAPNSTQNSLEISAIRDGLVIMKDGTFRSVILAKSINFDLMSVSEQEAVEYAYQSFLNSLYFDIQIFVRSRKIDMRPYLEKMQKVRSEMNNLLLGMLMEDYIYYINDLVQDINIMNKEFYVIVNYTSAVDAGGALQKGRGLFSGLLGGKQQGIVKIDEADLAKAKTELGNRAQNVISGLSQLGVQAAALSTEELIELYYNTYNPDIATRQTLRDTSVFNVPVITKGEGRAVQPNLEGSH